MISITLRRFLINGTICYSTKTVKDNSTYRGNPSTRFYNHVNIKPNSAVKGHLSNLRAIMRTQSEREELTNW